MKSRIVPVLVYILSLALFPELNAQNADAALMKLAAIPNEKLYIHYDKEYYVAGETIYFKAYLYSDGKPSGLSNNLFLQLTDEKGKVVSTKKFPVLGAVSKGSISLPDTLPQGNYYIRSLTPVMFNEEEDFIYRKNIFVFRPGSSTPSSNSAQTVSVKFFPESGDLVDGILTTVGFKSVDQSGIPVDISGVIRTDDGTTIASFKSFHDGIGKVPFKPQAGKKYIAEVETPAGKRTYELPAVKPSGINLKITDEKGGKKFQLSRGEKDKSKYVNIKLVAQINNHVVNDYDITFEPEYPSVIGHLLTDSLPSGILHLTVFSSEGLPLAERLCFVNNHEYVSNGSIVTSKFSEAKRSANEIEISFDEPIQRSCSVSVTDASGGSFNDNENIWSRFLLTSDLKGYVYNPAWYFENSNDSTKLALDNLMLTHGWSRFNWTKILAGQFPENKNLDEPMLLLTGKVMDDKNKESMSGGVLNIYLEAEDSSSLTYDVPVDAAGNFRLDSLMFFGKGKVFYTYSDSKGKLKPALVVLDEHSLNKMAENIPSVVTANMISHRAEKINSKGEIDSRFNYVKARLDEVKELEKVTVQAKSNKRPQDVVNEKYTSGVFRAPGKINLDNINEPANDLSMNAVDYIKNRIPQVEVQGGSFVNRKNFSLSTGQKWLIGVFINGVPADIFQLRLLRTKDIALVKFYEAGFVGVGSSFPGGAIAVYTKEQDKNEQKPEKLSFVEYNGYSISKEFYSPDYKNPDVKPATDNRTTLYWNADLYTDTESKTVKLNFFNNDFSKKLKVVVEGFDANGKLIHIEKILSGQ